MTTLIISMALSINYDPSPFCTGSREPALNDSEGLRWCGLLDFSLLQRLRSELMPDISVLPWLIASPVKLIEKLGKMS